MSDHENPKPQPRPDRSGIGGDPVPLELAGKSLNTERDKLAIVMVGLPGTGKTYLARRIARYLEFFQNVKVKTFTVADYRRKICGTTVPASFFESGNEHAWQQLMQCWVEAMKDLKEFLVSEQETGDEGEECPTVGRVGFLDGLHLNREYRKRAVEELEAIGIRPIFIESTVTDKTVSDFHFQEVLEHMPDYQGRSEEEVRKDWATKVENVGKLYEGINAHGDEETLSWVKITNLEKFVINRVRTYIPGRIVQFLLNMHPRQRTIYLSRHGQSEYNALGKVGGDSSLTAQGQEYGKRLAAYAENVISKGPDGEVLTSRLWTSTLQRTRQTASKIKHPVIQKDGRPFVVMRDKRWTNLDEIYAGICDGMTYEEIAAKYPVEAKRRKENKLSYRYPRGESYMDLIQRLEPIVHELERHEDPLLIIGHQAVLRIIYCYLKGLPRSSAPRTSMPLHTVIKLEPRSYECYEERLQLIEGELMDTPSH